MSTADIDVVGAVRRFIEHPITIIFAAVNAVSQVAQIPFLDPLLVVLWSYSGEVLAVVTVVYSQLAPEFEWLPQQELWIVFILAAVLFVATRLNTLYEAYQDRVEDNS